MSWKALDWATGIRVGSLTMRLILILLANKADEKFSCYLARRLAELPTPPSTSLRRKTPWCGECEDEQSRTITVTPPDGVDDGRNLGRGRRGGFQRSAWFSTVVNRWN